MAAPAATQLVERVVDGDTIIVQGVGRVRLIGVDTRRRFIPAGRSSVSARKRARLRNGCSMSSACAWSTDQERTDRYGRTLAYVHLPNGTFANAENVRQGYGHAYTRFPFR